MYIYSYYPCRHSSLSDSALTWSVAVVCACCSIAADLADAVSQSFVNIWSVCSINHIMSSPTSTTSTASAASRLRCNTHYFIYYIYFFCCLISSFYCQPQRTFGKSLYYSLCSLVYTCQPCCIPNSIVMSAEPQITLWQQGSYIISFYRGKQPV